MKKKVAILQSSYIPWKGYFDLINQVDEFILYDDAQYTKRDWRNRNLIQSKTGLIWLTIPVKQHGKRYQKINETEVVDSEWTQKHWQSLVRCYGKAPFFKAYQQKIEQVYHHADSLFLSRINYQFIRIISDILGIHTPISWSSDYKLDDGRSERLLSLCQQAKADIYISGPSAQNYLDTQLFSQSGIQVEWVNYLNYPEYKQQHQPFEHGVSILDLIFNAGPDATRYMHSFKSH